MCRLDLLHSPMSGVGQHTGPGMSPRLARIYGEENLSKLVQSHPGDQYTGDIMWDIHHSPIWKELYSNDGYFAGDKLGMSLAFEMDGVNPFHNIGVQYSMTPMMLTILNLPRHIRNTFRHISLVGIIPGNGRCEAKNIDPYVEVLVDELLYLSQSSITRDYQQAPVEIKLKLLLHVLDYPGMSKLFNQHGSGALSGCHWCMVHGEKCPHLDKVIYANNRTYLCKDDPLRLDENHFAKRKPELSLPPVERSDVVDRAYRDAYSNAPNKSQAQYVATATGCKGLYALSRIPGHDRLEQSVPDAMHTVKDVIKNVMDLCTGRVSSMSKIITAEENLGRAHVTGVDEDAIFRSSFSDVPSPEIECPVKRKRASKQEKVLPFLLKSYCNVEGY